MLEGKTVLITGAARRVGAKIARVLHGAGANMALHYRSSAAEAERLAGNSRPPARARCASAECDLLDVTQFPALIAHGPGLRRPRHPGEQRLDLLPDPGGRDHRDRLGRPDRHQSQGTAVPRPGGQRALHARGGLIINVADITACGRCAATRSTASPRRASSCSPSPRPRDGPARARQRGGAGAGHVARGRAR